MVHHSLTKIDNDLRKIADMLMLHGTLVECPGLIHGKTGIAIFFFHYSQYVDNELFEDYALDLIGEIQSQIHNNSPADYENGIAGIGVGMNYLINNHYFSTDGDFFTDFDKRMYRAVMYDPWQDFSLYDGLTGYGLYWIKRMQKQTLSEQARECLLYITGQIEEKLRDIPAKEQSDVYCFLSDLQKITGFYNCSGLIKELTSINHNSLHLADSAIGNLARVYQQSHYFEHVSKGEVDAAMKQIQDLDMKNPPSSMGLLTGYAGEGMLRLTALNQVNKLWMYLL